MRIVCICDDETAANCVGSGLMERHEIPLVIIPDYATKNPKKKKKSRKTGTLISKAFRELFFKAFPRKATRKKVRDEIHRRGSGKLNLIENCSNVKSVPTYAINAQSTADLMSEHDPDILFVCGAPILKQRIFGIPKFGSVNFHFGFSLKYKGQHSLLWAYNRADHESLGGTFLKIDAGVDTGKPISFVFPEVDHRDSVEAIEAKLALLARENISHAIDVAANPISRSLKSEAGKQQEEFMVRFADYGPKDHVVYHIQRFRNQFFRKGRLQEEKVTVV